MKTNTRFLGVMLLAGLLAGSANVFAQGRGNHGGGHGNGNGHGRGQDNREWNNHHPKGNNNNYHYNDHHNNDHNYQGRNDSHGWNNHHSNHGWDDRRVVHYERYDHHRTYHRPPHWVPAYGYYNHPHSRPRYVYYRDYNVYYDCFRGIYITFTGRNWVYSQQIPLCMNHVNFNQIAFVDLDYYDDDLPGFISRRPGGFISIHAGF